MPPVTARRSTCRSRSATHHPGAHVRRGRDAPLPTRSRDASPTTSHRSSTRRPAPMRRSISARLSARLRVVPDRDRYLRPDRDHHLGPALPVVFTGPDSVTIIYTARDDSGNTGLLHPHRHRGRPLRRRCSPALRRHARVQRPRRSANDRPRRAGVPRRDDRASTTATANPPLATTRPRSSSPAARPTAETVVTWTTSDSSNHTATCSAGLRSRTPPRPLSPRCPARSISSAAYRRACLLATPTCRRGSTLFTGDDVCDDADHALRRRAAAAADLVRRSRPGGKPGRG